MDRLIARVWSEGLQAVQSLVQLWVVGCAGARATPGAAAAHGSERSSFRLTTSGPPQATSPTSWMASTAWWPAAWRWPSPPWPSRSQLPGRSGPLWAPCSASCSGTGVPPRCSWAMWATPSSVRCSPAWCFRPPAGPRPSASCWWPPPCSATPASACPVGCSQASVCSRPIGFTCSSVCTRPAGPTPAFPVCM